MKKLSIFIIFIIVCILLCSILYIYDEEYIKYNKVVEFAEIIEFQKNIPSKHTLGYYRKVPYILRNQMKELQYIDFEFLKRNYGYKDIYICDTKPEAHLNVDIETMKLKSFIEDICGDSPCTSHYMKYTDFLDFFQSIGMKETINQICRKYIGEIPMYPYSTFFMGAKGTQTDFHHDSDYFNMACVLKGRKVFYLVHPTHKLKKKNSILRLQGRSIEQDIFTDLSLNDKENIQNLIDKGKIYKCVLNEGDILNIPRNVWHAVENEETSISFGFLYTRWCHFAYGLI